MLQLKALREAKNISQEKFAKELNVAQNTVSNWERGVRNPDNEMLIKIANYFDVSIDYLLDKKTPSVSKEKTFQILQIYDALSDEGKHKLEAYVDDLLSNPKNRK